MKIFDHPFQLAKLEKRKDIRILPFYEKEVAYTNCFVLLNPFYQLVHRKIDFELNRPKWIEGQKSQILQNYQPYYWSDFLRDSGIDNIKELMYCLHVNDKNYAERFKKVRKKTWLAFNKNIYGNQLISNSSSYLSILLINPILNGLMQLGFTEVILYDLLEEHKLILEISDLIASENELPSEFRLATKNREILIYQEFEHYETFVYSTNEKLLDKFVKEIGLEGFLANEKSTLLWSEIEYGNEEEMITVNYND